MHSLIILVKRFLLFLTDTAIWPFRTLYSLWLDPSRGRYLIYGLPSIVIGLLAVFAAVYASTASQDTFIRRYERAKQEAIVNKDWREAITFARKLMELQPENDDVKLELSRILSQDDNEETRQISRTLAEGIFASLAPRESSGHPDAHVRQAQVILQTTDRRFSPAQRLKMASEHIKMALAVVPEHKDALTVMAEIHNLKGEYQQAEEIYIQLFRDHPGYIAKIVEMARRQNRAPEARPYLREAVEKYKKLLNELPKNVPEQEQNFVNYVRRLANCYSMLGDYESGATVIRESMDRVADPVRKNALRRTLSNIYVAKAKTYASRVDTDVEARRNFLQSLIDAHREDPENDIPKIDLTLFSLADFPESAQARSVYDGRQDPDQAPDGVLQHLGTHEVLHGDVNLGIELLEKGIEKNPRNHQILNNLAYSLIDRDLERALDLANRAVFLQPEQPNYRDTRGNILMNLGRYDKAINDFEAAMSAPEMKTNISVFEALVKCYEAQGMTREAKSYQEKVDELRSQQSPSNGASGN